MSTVFRSVACTIDDEEARVALRYDPASPLVVLIDFGYCAERRERMVWTVSRDILAGRVEGLSDFRCWTDGLWHFSQFSAPEGAAVVRIERMQIQIFLAATRRLVPYGNEIDEQQLDAVIARLLAGAR